MSSAQNQDHLPFMDAARGALMSLGVLLHAANVFSDSSWAIQNAQTSYIFDYMIDLIHLFRMPAFFIVSGFFCHMSLQKYGHRLFISKRVPRILIPMIAVALSLNSLQNFILSQYYTNPFSLLDSNYWLLGKWVSHLWFLHCILFYFAAAALLYKYSLKPLNTVASLFNELILRSKGLYLLILPLATMLTLKLSYLFPDTSYYLYSVGEAVLYSIFFAFGALIGHNRPLLIAFIKPGIITSILVLSILTLHAYFSNSHTLLGNILNLYISHLQTWLLCLACFFIFYTLCNSRSKKLKYIADASYSIYLFHHVFIILFGLIIISLDINIWLKFITLVSTTYIATLLFHHFIVLRLPIMKYLFNGVSVKTNASKSVNNQ